MISEDMTQEDVDSILDGDFSCETTEDLYEPTDDELLYPGSHYTWAHTCLNQDKKEKIKCENGWIYF